MKIYKRKFEESGMDLPMNILIESKPFIQELKKRLEKENFNVSVNTKKILGSKSSVTGFYKTILKSDSFEIEIFHFLHGVAYISGSRYNIFSKMWYSFDDEYAQKLKRYSNANDIINTMIKDLTR